MAIKSVFFTLINIVEGYILLTLIFSRKFKLLSSFAKLLLFIKKIFLSNRKLVFDKIISLMSSEFKSI